MAFLVCCSTTPPDDHTRNKAVYLNQRFYELIFEHCRDEHGRYVVLREIASLKYKSPTLVVLGDQLIALERELVSLGEFDFLHLQIAEFRQVCQKAMADGVALAISGDMYPELW